MSENKVQHELMRTTHAVITDITSVDTDAAMKAAARLLARSLLKRLEGTLRVTGERLYRHVSLGHTDLLLDLLHSGGADLICAPRDNLLAVRAL